MAHKFSNEEKFDMLECYLKVNRNSQNASASYLEKFPERMQPHRTVFGRIVSNLLNYGSFYNKRDRYDIDNVDRTNNILEVVNNNPRISVRQIAGETNIPKTTVHKTLKQRKYHPYKPTIVQALNNNDFRRRLEFCRWYNQKCEEQPDFQSRVIWTDESRFTNCGVFNKHNYHHWATENPHVTTQRRFQTRFGFNVWCGMIGITFSLPILLLRSAYNPFLNYYF